MKQQKSLNLFTNFQQLFCSFTSYSRCLMFYVHQYSKLAATHVLPERIAAKVTDILDSTMQLQQNQNLDLPIAIRNALDTFVTKHIGNIRNLLSFLALKFGFDTSSQPSTTDNCNVNSNIISYPNGDLYSGESYFGMKHGHGAMIFRDGRIYSGEWYEDKMHGIGQLQSGSQPIDDSVSSSLDNASNDVACQYRHCIAYCDQFKTIVQTAAFGMANNFNSSLDGMITTQIDQCITYTGQFKHDQPNGHGTLSRTSDGRVVYDGQWMAGIKHGQGVFTYSNGDVYSGRLEGDLPHGAGVCETSCGSTYKGQYVRGELSHDIEISYGNGDIYSGINWLEGTYKWADGAVYTGQWNDSQQNGTGVMWYANGGQYSGQWVRGMRSGKGSLTFTDGGVFEGHWLGDKKQGYGEYSYSCGDVYKGDFVSDVCHGMCEVWYANGDIYRGECAEGLKHGIGILTRSDGEVVHEGVWKNGVAVMKYL